MVMFVAESLSFRSFLGLVKALKARSLEQKQRIAVKLKDGQLQLPLGSRIKTWFGLDACYLSMPSNFGAFGVIS